MTNNQIIEMVTNPNDPKGYFVNAKIKTPLGYHFAAVNGVENYYNNYNYYTQLGGSSNIIGDLFKDYNLNLANPFLSTNPNSKYGMQNIFVSEVERLVVYVVDIPEDILELFKY